MPDDRRPAWPRATAALDELAARRQAIPTIPSTIVGDATRAVTDLLRAAIKAPACYEPTIYAAPCPAGALVTVGPMPLTAEHVAAIVAYVAGDPPPEAEIAREVNEAIRVSDAERGVLAAVRAWHLARGNDRERDILRGKLAAAADRLAVVEGTLTENESRVLGALWTEEWRPLERVAGLAGLDSADTLAALRSLFRRGLAQDVGGDWKRK